MQNSLWLLWDISIARRVAFESDSGKARTAFVLASSTVPQIWRYELRRGGYVWIEDLEPHLFNVTGAWPRHAVAGTALG